MILVMSLHYIEAAKIAMMDKTETSGSRQGFEYGYIM